MLNILATPASVNTHVSAHCFSAVSLEWWMRMLPPPDSIFSLSAVVEDSRTLSNKWNKTCSSQKKKKKKQLFKQHSSIHSKTTNPSNSSIILSVTVSPCKFPYSKQSLQQLRARISQLMFTRERLETAWWKLLRTVLALTEDCTTGNRLNNSLTFSVRHNQHDCDLEEGIWWILSYKRAKTECKIKLDLTSDESNHMTLKRHHIFTQTKESFIFIGKEQPFYTTPKKERYKNYIS